MRLVLVRHGATEWSETARHTSVTDVPLLESGRQGAARLAGRLGGRGFALVLTSPRARARDTAALAGFGERAAVEEDLAEIHYGDYEGLTTAEIRVGRP